MYSLSPQVISGRQPTYAARDLRSQRGAMPKSQDRLCSPLRLYAHAIEGSPSAPTIVPPKGRNLSWRQGVGALKNLTFMPMWHNTHDKLNQFFALQDIPRGPTTWDWPLDAIDPNVLALPGHASLHDFLVHQQVDSFALLHAGTLVQECYLGETQPHTRHSIASMSRTLTGAVAGILVDRGLLDLTSPLETWAPELASTAWKGVTLRNLLDMRSGITSSVPASIGAMGEGKAGLLSYLLTLQRDGEAGGPFKYRTSDTEMLGFMCQQVTGEPMAALWSRLLWQPMGAADDASVMVDPQGTALCGGGISVTLRDTARFAQLLLQGGILPQSGNSQATIPNWYIKDMRHGDADAKQAFGGTMIQLPLPEAMYRNQSWLLDAKNGVSLLMGAGGQVAYLDPQNQFACLATSHWLMPYDAKRMATWLEAFPTLRNQVLQARLGASH
jgi:CubicO group peptidase (beta-lactamase class C family)